MRTHYVLSLFAGLAMGQKIQFSEFYAALPPTQTGPPLDVASDPVDYSPASAAASAAQEAAKDPASVRRSVKRDACASEPQGAGPVTTPDTAADFLANQQYSDIATDADVPQGYSLVFSNYQGATEGNGYLGYYSLGSYDTIQCQQYCDAASSCYAFNVYLERDPSVEPGDGCPNPPSTTTIKCTLWGYAITNASATSTGQWRDDFQVVVAASNGYDKLAPPPSYDNFQGPTAFGGAINAPSNPNTFIGSKYYSGPYDPSQCAASCQETTAYDKANLVSSAGTYDACNFFNAYVLSENDVPQGTYCSLYTKPWDASYSTNFGQYDGQGNYFSVSQSYGYTLSPQDPGVVSS